MVNKIAQFIPIIMFLLATIVVFPTNTKAQAPPPPPTKPSQTPIDGGLVLLAAAGGGYAIKKLRNKKE